VYLVSSWAQLFFSIPIQDIISLVSIIKLLKMSEFSSTRYIISISSSGRNERRDLGCHQDYSLGEERRGNKCQTVNQLSHYSQLFIGDLLSYIASETEGTTTSSNYETNFPINAPAECVWVYAQTTHNTMEMNVPLNLKSSSKDAVFENLWECTRVTVRTKVQGERQAREISILRLDSVLAKFYDNCKMEAYDD